MNKFIIKTFFFTSLLLAILFTLNYIVEKGLRKSKLEYYAAWNDIYNSKCDADMVLLGPSRTEYMISPRILDSMLYINTYNLGMDGWFFSMEYQRMKIYLQHNKTPKYIVTNIDSRIFSPNTDLFKYEQFIPYLSDTMIQNATKNHIGEFTSREIYFPLFKYCNHPDLIKEGVKNYFNGQSITESKEKGYYPWPGKFDMNAFKDHVKHYPNGIMFPINDSVVGQFIDFVKFCKENNVKLIFDFAPLYYEEQHFERSLPEVMKIINSVAQQYEIPILDYRTDSINYDTSYFANVQHLNQKGAELFSKKLATDLQKYIK